MKYFTKARYEELQISGFLCFPETENEWEENIAIYEEEGLNFAESCREALEYRKQDLLRFLPESFHSYIYDGTLNSQFPSADLRAMAKQWRSEYEERVKRIGSEYRSHYQSIKHKLPPQIVKLCEKSLHDAKVLSFEKFNDDIFILLLDCSGGYHYLTNVKITFRGVKELSYQENLIGSYWLYDEVYAVEAGFELHVLLESPLSELTLTAEDVSIEILKGKTEV
jgi:hypothetical protein